eukprot:4640083-Alexandrium_andersonii.AAC.1
MCIRDRRSTSQRLQIEQSRQAARPTSEHLMVVQPGPNCPFDRCGLLDPQPQVEIAHGIAAGRLGTGARGVVGRSGR